MAIKKLKTTVKPAKHSKAPKTTPVSDIEAKRREFQAAASGKTTTPTALPKHHSASRRTLIILVGALLAFIGTIIVVYAYFWYQSPEKIVMDAIMNSASATSTSYRGEAAILGSKDPQITYSGAFGGGQSKFDVGILMPPGGSLKNLNASVVTTQNNLYLKIDKASQLISQTAPPAVKQSFQPYLPMIRDQVDDKWIAVNQNDIDLYRPVTKVSRCVVDIFQTLTTNRSAAATLGGLYRQAPFLQIAETSQSTSTTGRYTLTLDQVKYDAFKQKLYKSDFYASLAACNRQSNDVKASDLAGLSIDLTIDKAKREVTSVAAVQKGYFASQITLHPRFNEPVAIQVPKNLANVDAIKAQAFRDYIKNTLKGL